MKASLTKKDTDELVAAFEKNFLTKAEFISAKYDFKEKFDELEQKIKNLPTKDQFYSAMSELMGEVKKIRGEQVVSGQHYRDFNQRLDDLEKQLQNIQTATI